MVEIDVMLNEWFGTFYNSVQACFSEPGSVALGDYYGELLTFFVIAGVYVIIMTLNTYFVQHYNFRWRTAMNEHYTGLWKRVRHIEGASQRIQEDAMRFADIMEGLGAGLLDAVMTLVAFTPILIGLSVHVGEIPVVGKIAQGLLWVALGWSLLGTMILFLTGYYLPLLQFRNQRVEAAYRDELVLGMKDPSRAEPMTLAGLFDHVRKNYFKLYFHYTYFNVVRYSYLQASVLVPYVALAPTITSKAAVTAGFTLGVMQQTIRAFGRIQDSFQYLVRNWPTIVELLSIYKRLKAFDLAEKGLPLQDIDLETDK
jgi:peptide/bleomycin uptake transporter